VAAGLRTDAEGLAINIGTDREISIAELAALMIEISGSGSRVSLVPKEAVYDRGYEDIPRRVPTVARMHQILGVRDEVSLEDGLARTIEWFKRQ
jgi:UDP-glucose 4-epimerase